MLAEKFLVARRADRTKYKSAYRIAAGAAIAASAGAPADAAVQYFVGPIEIESGALQPIDVDLDSYTDIQLKNYVFGGGNYQGATVPYAPGKIVGFRVPSTMLNYFTALSSGSYIDESSLADFQTPFAGSLAYGTTNPNAQFNDVVGGFLGFAFPIGPTDLFIAWMRVDINNEAGTFTIIDWAYEDQTGVGITVGDTGLPPVLGDFDGDVDVDGADLLEWQQNFGNPFNAIDLADWRTNYGTPAPALAAGTAIVPEPGTLGLLAAGACGVSAMRRRRAKYLDQNRT
ncbi:MAG: PEP-CTERM sorting domain-containing protein [Planctomycetota bacterium]